MYKTFPSTSTPTLRKGDGDGTVNIRSLLACTRWAKESNARGKAFRHRVYPKVDHNGILQDPASVQDVLEAVREANIVEEMKRMKEEPFIEIVP